LTPDVVMRLEGFRRGRRLEKLGLKAQDTSELFMDMRVPVSNRLGEEGAGFKMVMHKLVHERLIISVSAAAISEAALQWTVDYTKDPQGLRQIHRGIPEHPFQGGGADAHDLQLRGRRPAGDLQDRW
jgi:alkylation response protein AidB-like acyl-CoA dehydrogenase